MSYIKTKASNEQKFRKSIQKYLKFLMKHNFKDHKLSSTIKTKYKDRINKYSDITAKPRH